MKISKRDVVFVVVCFATIVMINIVKDYVVIPAFNYLTSRDSNEASSVEQGAESYEENALAPTDIIACGPGGEFNFVKQNFTCTDYVCGNDMFYATPISPYISSGAKYDIDARDDNDGSHYVRLYVRNDSGCDTSAVDCQVYGLRVDGLEGYSICGVSVGDNIDDVISMMGRPKEQSVSQYDCVSYAVWDIDGWRLTVHSNIVVGSVASVEVVYKPYIEM